MRPAVVAVLAFAVGTFVGDAARADQHHDDLIAERIDQMRDLGEHMKMLTRSSGASPADDLRHVAGLRGGIKMLRSAFPEGSVSRHSQASPDIWARKAEFDRLVDRYDAETAELMSVLRSEPGKAPEQLRVLGQVCTDCHVEFRKRSYRFGR